VTEKSASGNENPSPVAFRKASLRVQHAKKAVRGDDPATSGVRRVREGRKIALQGEAVTTSLRIFSMSTLADQNLNFPDLHTTSNRREPAKIRSYVSM
jgi:hypothetical protein